MKYEGGIVTKILILIIGTIVASFYLFPIGFHGLPSSLNTKQMLAVVGLVIFVFQCLRESSFSFSKGVLVSFFLSCLFSLWCFFSIIDNNTDDNTYALYFMSFIVWLAGAYGTCKIIKFINGSIDLRALTNFIAAACVAQCAIALVIDNVPNIKEFVDHWIVQDTMPLKVQRLYGIGMSLDSGGVRLCMALLLLSYQLAHVSDNDNKFMIVLQVAAFVVITILGNMIARTTTVGAAMGLLYIALYRLKGSLEEITRKKLARLYIYVLLGVPLLLCIIYFYDTNQDFHNKLRFAFEAFFNYFETGEFRTDSSDVLMDRMWVWPHDTHGWIVGYGLFEDLIKEYAQTDIGYCRFTMYCGLVGLSIFSMFFIYNATVVARRLDKAVLWSLVLLSFTFVLWIKVSTDIFQLYALLFCIAAEKTKQTTTT